MVLTAFIEDIKVSKEILIERKNYCKILEI